MYDLSKCSDRMMLCHQHYDGLGDDTADHWRDAAISLGSRPKKQSSMSPHGLLRADVHGERLSLKVTGGDIGLFRTFYTFFITAIYMLSKHLDKWNICHICIVNVQLLWLVRHKSYNQPLETKLTVKNGKRLKAFAYRVIKNTGRHDANILTMLRKWIG